MPQEIISRPYYQDISRVLQKNRPQKGKNEYFGGSLVSHEAVVLSCKMVQLRKKFVTKISVKKKWKRTQKM